MWPTELRKKKQVNPNRPNHFKRFLYTLTLRTCFSHPQDQDNLILTNPTNHAPQILHVSLKLLTWRLFPPPLSPPPNSPLSAPSHKQTFKTPPPLSLISPQIKHLAISSHCYCYHGMCFSFRTYIGRTHRCPKKAGPRWFRTTSGFR